MKQLLLSIAAMVSLCATSQTIGITPFATGFTDPVEIAHPAGDARLFVVQQGGAIRILNPDQTINATNFLNLSGIISTGSERGLLGLAFHPDYATNGLFFVNYTNTAGNTVVARYSVSSNPNVANPTGTILLTVTQPFSNHNGGTLRFGPDGYLYIGMGDGGSGGDPGNRAQNINENLGKMLRIDVNSGTTYGIPADNPYAGTVAGNDEIWAIGLRNPWKYSFNRLNGDLWIADVGQGAVEEINKISPNVPGLNFGWKCYEGNNVYTAGCAVATTTYTFPIATYTHTGGACSITGGYVYTGTVYPNFTDKYFFADYCSNKIGMTDASGVITWSSTFSGNNFTTFGEDRDGQLYIAGGSSGVVYKLVDTSLAVQDFEKSSVQLYPNPATSQVFVKSGAMQFPARVVVTDLTGKTLLNQSLAAESEAIQTANLQSGIYLVSVNDNAGANFTAKLSVQ